MGGSLSNLQPGQGVVVQGDCPVGKVVFGGGGRGGDNPAIVLVESYPLGPAHGDQWAATFRNARTRHKTSTLVDDGPVFRQLDRWGNIGGSITGQTVARVVKEYAETIGFDPSAYSGHSLRAGFVSECDRRGITSSAVRLVTGHQSDAMLNVYTRPRSLFEFSAGAFFDE